MNQINNGNLRLQLARMSRMARTLIRDPYVFSPHFKYIFIFGHMRSYTSLLAHLLGNSPEISGYFELHQPYRKVLDFLSMRVRISEGMDYHTRGRYLLDKILHNVEISPRILESKRLSVILTLREPVRSLQSLSRMLVIESMDHALEYYLNRLKFLTQLSAIGGPKFFLDADDLVSNIDPVLTALSSFLGLKEILSSSYSVNKFTGQRGYGDSSGNIMQGRIMEKKLSSEEGLPQEIFIRANAAYLTARQVLMEGCLTTEKINRSL